MASCFFGWKRTKRPMEVLEQRGSREELSESLNKHPKDIVKTYHYHYDSNLLGFAIHLMNASPEILGCLLENGVEARHPSVSKHILNQSISTKSLLKLLTVYGMPFEKRKPGILADKNLINLYNWYNKYCPQYAEIANSLVEADDARAKNQNDFALSLYEPIVERLEAYSAEETESAYQQAYSALAEHCRVNMQICQDKLNSDNPNEPLLGDASHGKVV